MCWKSGFLIRISNFTLWDCEKCISIIVICNRCGRFVQIFFKKKHEIEKRNDQNNAHHKLHEMKLKYKLQQKFVCFFFKMKNKKYFYWYFMQFDRLLKSLWSMTATHRKTSPLFHNTRCFQMAVYYFAQSFQLIIWHEWVRYLEKRSQLQWDVCGFLDSSKRFTVYT